MGIGVVRPDSKYLLEFRDRLFRLTLEQERQSIVVARQRIVRIESQRFGQFRGCALRIAFFEQFGPAVVVGFGQLDVSLPLGSPRGIAASRTAASSPLSVFCSTRLN